MFERHLDNSPNTMLSLFFCPEVVRWLDWTIVVKSLPTEKPYSVVISLAKDAAVQKEVILLKQGLVTGWGGGGGVCDS